MSGDRNLLNQMNYMNYINNRNYINKISTPKPPSAIELKNMSLLQAILYDKMSLFKVLLLIAYTIAIILLYIKNPSNIITDHTNVSILITAISALFMYYINMRIEGVDEKGWFKFNTLPMSIVAVFIFFIVVFSLYQYDPSVIKQHFNKDNIVVVACALLIGLITYYMYKTIGNKTKSTPKPKIINFKFDIFKYIVLLLCFITTVSFLYIYNPGGYIVENFQLPIILLLSTAGILIASFLLLYIFSAGAYNSSAGTQLKKDQANLLSILSYFLAGSFGTLFTIYLVQYLIGLFSSNSGSIYADLKSLFTTGANDFKSEIQGIHISKISAVNNLVKIIIVGVVAVVAAVIALTLLYFLFKQFKDTLFAVASPIIRLATEKLFAVKSQDFIILAIVITLNLYYFLHPYVSNYIAKEGGKMLVNSPKNLDSEQMISSYIDLNGSSDNSTDSYEYTFALSFWIYIDSASPNFSGKSSFYASLMNYGNKPNVSYCVSENTLRITMPNTYSEEEIKRKKWKLDENGDIIIYIMPQYLLQKWNNIVINYTGGTMDIFYNNELVKSFPEIVPYMNYDNLTIGEANGVMGGLCNLIYFKKSLTMSQIDSLYNYVAVNTPPVYNTNDLTENNGKSSYNVFNKIKMIVLDE
jgi:hypothetical protein